MQREYIRADSWGNAAVNISIKTWPRVRTNQGDAAITMQSKPYSEKVKICEEPEKLNDLSVA